MSRKQPDIDQLLDRAVGEIRDDAMPAEAERAAADRVWELVSQEVHRVSDESPANQRIRDCADFQALIPAYLQGALTDAKALLVADHVNECVPCRRALKQARSGQRKRSQAATPSQSGWVAKLGWRVAAAAVIFLAVAGLSLNTDVLKVEAGGVIHIEAVDGELLRVTDEGSVPVQVGEAVTLRRGEGLRTAKGSRATLRLADDSEIEMDERAELAVYDQAYFWNRANSDPVIDLARGNVIVAAADRGDRQLYLNTNDSNVATSGTVFAVNSGIKGTRVSVFDGQAEVAYTGHTGMVGPGQQITTRAGLSRVPLEHEIAWSGNLDRHLELLREVNELGRELDRVLTPELRYSTRLLDLAPPETVVYVGIPNVSESLGEAYQIVEDKIGSSEALQQWWNESVVSQGGDIELRQIIERVQNFGEQLGEEVVVTLQVGADGEVNPPLLLAELTAPDDFLSYLENELAEIGSLHGEGIDQVLIVEGERPDLSGLEADLFLWIRGDLLVAAFDREPLLQLAADMLQQGQLRVAAPEFRQQLAGLYTDGVEWVFGADLETIFDQGVEGRERAELDSLGLLDMQHLIGEREQRGGRTENRIVLSFGQARRGLASWLDEPAPMGSLNFISPNASLAAAFVMREPASLVDELFEIVGSMDDDFEAEFEEFEREHSIDVRNDIAAPLGGEFAFALDGPILPKPSWKLIVEVYDPVQLQRTIEWSVEELHRLITDEGRQGLELGVEEVSGRTLHRLESLDTGIAAYYMFVDGYFIAGPSRSVLLSALQTRDSGVTLASSTEFTDLLPTDGEVNFSGVAYQNLGTLLGPLARLGGAKAQLNPEQAQLVQELATSARPTDRITFVYTHEGGLISSGLASFFSMHTLANMQELVGRAIDQQKGQGAERRTVSPRKGREST